MEDEKEDNESNKGCFAGEEGPSSIKFDETDVPEPEEVVEENPKAINDEANAPDSEG